MLIVLPAHWHIILRTEYWSRSIYMVLMSKALLLKYFIVIYIDSYSVGIVIYLCGDLLRVSVYISYSDCSQKYNQLLYDFFINF